VLQVQLQPVVCSIPFDQSPPQHFLNKPSVIATYLGRLKGMLPAAKCGFVKLL
jgi:hypothetical protein